MLTSVDLERSVDGKESIKVQSSSHKTSNVVLFKSSEKIKEDSRQQAIEAIRKRSQQLHW